MRSKSVGMFGILGVFLAGSIFGATWKGECVGVVDGDTLEVDREGTVETVDLADIDAPELGQPFGEEARDFLAGLVVGKEVEVAEDPVGSSRGVRVSLQGENIARAVLAAGYAWTDDTTDQQLIIARMTAEGNRLGLWKAASAEPPWVYRERMARSQAEVEEEQRAPLLREEKRLSEVAGKIELEKNSGDKTIIAGLPPKKAAESGDERPDVDESYQADGSYVVNFTCEQKYLRDCARAQFRESYEQFYDRSASANSTSSLDYGDGRQEIQIHVSPDESLGVDCNCDQDGQCTCTMTMAPEGD